MEKFVNNLFKSTTDLSGLTHRSIRERYLTHTRQEEYVGDEKAKLKALVEKKLMEIVAAKLQNTATRSPKQNKAKVVAAKRKQPQSSKKKRKKAVETSERDEEYDHPSETNSPAESPTSKDSSQEDNEPAHVSSDFEEESPVRKKIRRPAKRKIYSTDESESESDSEKETVQKFLMKKLHGLPQQEAKRRNVKTQKSDSSDFDFDVRELKGKRQKHGSGDRTKVGLLGKDRGKATRKGSLKQSKKIHKRPNELDSEESDEEYRLTIDTESDSASSDMNIKVAQKTRKSNDFTSENSDATITYENLSDSDTVGSRSMKKKPQCKVKKKTKLKAHMCDRSESDSEVEKAKERKQRHSSGKERKLLSIVSELEQIGKDGDGGPRKGQKKRSVAIVSDSDESEVSERGDSSDSGQSDVNTEQDGATEMSRNVGEISNDENTDECSSGPDTDVIKTRPVVKRAGKNTMTAKMEKSGKGSENSDEEFTDKRSSYTESVAGKRTSKNTRTKAEQSLVDSGTDSEAVDDRHIRTAKQASAGKHRKASAEEKKSKSKVASDRSNQSQNVKKPGARKISKKHAVSSSDQEESDNSSETLTNKSLEKKDLAVRKKKPSGAKGRMDTSQSEASSLEEDQPTVTLKKEALARDAKQSSDDSEAGELSSPDDGTSHKDKQKKKTKGTEGSKPSSPSRQVANLKAILRACNSMPVGKNYSIMFGKCQTDADFVKKLKRLLVAVGMTGRPSMKKAKDIRLKKELAELDTGNIISSKGRSLRDTRRGRFEYGAPIPEPMKRPVAPSCDTFKNLSGLVDSEGSDSSS